MAKKTKITPAQLAYRKERKRILQFIRRAEKRGYQFKTTVVPEIPKRITKASVEKLKKITPETLYSKAVYGGEATGGEIVSAEQGRKLEKKRRAQKAAETRKARKRKQKKPEQRQQTIKKKQKINIAPQSVYSKIVIGNFRSELVKSAKVHIAMKLLSWLNKLIDDNGLDAVAEMLQTATENGVELTHSVKYEDNASDDFMEKAMLYLKDQGDFYCQNTMEWISDWMATEQEIYENTQFETYD